MARLRARILRGCLAAAGAATLFALGQSAPALAAAAPAAGVPAAAAAAVPSAHPMSLDGTWSCTVPSGYVYDEVTTSNSCGFGYLYHLRLPADGVWSCGDVPTTFTYDEVTTSNACDPCPASTRTSTACGYRSTACGPA